jgi:hypothetical protein
MLSIHLRLGLPSGLFPSGFPTNNLYTFLLSPHSCLTGYEIKTTVGKYDHKYGNYGNNSGCHVNALSRIVGGSKSKQRRSGNPPPPPGYRITSALSQLHSELR